jgi:hypothetical protein
VLVVRELHSVEDDGRHGILLLSSSLVTGSLAGRYNAPARCHARAADWSAQSRSAFRLMAAPHVHIIQTRSPSTPPSSSPQRSCSW